MSDSQGPDSPPPPGALVLMCGLPAAGKSTLSAALLRDGAKELLPRLAPFGVSAVRVFWLSFDDVLGNLAAACGHTGYSPELWHQARDSVLRSVRHHFGVACGDGPPPAPLAQLGESGGGSGSSGGAPASGGDSFDVVLLDDNMHYRSMRRVYHRLARDGRLGCCTLCLPLPLAEALRRNAARQESARVADATVSHMAEVLQWPDPARHPWECSTISLPSASSSGAGALAASLAGAAVERSVFTARESWVGAEPFPWDRLAPLLAAAVPAGPPPCPRGGATRQQDSSKTRPRHVPQARQTARRPRRPAQRRRPRPPRARRTRSTYACAPPCRCTCSPRTRAGALRRSGRR